MSGPTGRLGLQPPAPLGYRAGVLRSGWAALAAVALLGACSGRGRGDRPIPVVVAPPPSNPLPPPEPPPACVTGALIDARRVCGLGVVGRGYVWNDPRLRAEARRLAARNLAGLLRTVVSSALVLEQDQDGYWSRQERYLEIDEALVDAVEASAEAEVWFDVEGTGPFRAPERTYACACMSTGEAGIRIDPAQAAAHAFARQYAVDEVPAWVADAEVHNDALKCALGYNEATFQPEDMLEPLIESVRAQLVGKTRSWVLSELEDRIRCAEGAGTRCRTKVRSLVEAVNEGVSRGVALTAVWLDPDGLGPTGRRGSAYGWGCVFDQEILDAARRRLEELDGRP